MFSKYIHVAFEWEPYKNSSFMGKKISQYLI